MNNSLNGTKSEGERFVNIATACFIGIILTIGLIGNSLVLYIYAYRFKASPFNIFIIFLAVMDFMFCALDMPLEIANMTLPNEFGGCKFVVTLGTVTAISTGQGLVAIAALRFNAVCRPLKQTISNKTARCLTVLFFVTSCLVSWPSAVIMTNVHTRLDDNSSYVTNCASSPEYVHTVYPLIYSMFQFLLFLGTFFSICVLYCITGSRLWKRKKYGIACHSTSRELTSSTSSEKYFETTRRKVTGSPSNNTIFSICKNGTKSLDRTLISNEIQENVINQDFNLIKSNAGSQNLYDVNQLSEFNTLEKSKYIRSCSSLTNESTFSNSLESNRKPTDRSMTNDESNTIAPNQSSYDETNRSMTNDESNTIAPNHFNYDETNTIPPNQLGCYESNTIAPNQSNYDESNTIAPNQSSIDESNAIPPNQLYYDDSNATPPNHSRYDESDSFPKNHSMYDESDSSPKNHSMYDESNSSPKNHSRYDESNAIPANHSSSIESKKMSKKQSRVMRSNSFPSNQSRRLIKQSIKWYASFRRPSSNVPNQSHALDQHGHNVQNYIAYDNPIYLEYSDGQNNGSSPISVQVQTLKRLSLDEFSQDQNSIRPPDLKSTNFNSYTNSKESNSNQQQIKMGKKNSLIKGSNKLDPVKMLVIMALIFFLSYVPHLSLMIYIEAELPLKLVPVSESIIGIIIRSYFLGSVCNPILYGCYNRKFREEVRSIWQSLKRRIKR